MAAASEILIPLLNPNEPEARLATLAVREGQRVSEGDLLCTLETTKSTMDFEAERSGFVVGLQAQQGDLLRAGTRLCWIADRENWTPPEREAGTGPDEVALPEGLRITGPGLDLAQQAGVNLTHLPLGPLVTQAMVREVLMASDKVELDIPAGPFDPTALVVYGAGGHGRSLIDLLCCDGAYHVIGLLDDRLEVGSEVLGLEVLGGREALSELLDRGVRLAVNAVGGIGDLTSRVRVFSLLLEAGFACPTVIHPAGWVEQSAALAPGSQVFAHTYVGSAVEIGFGVIVNTGAVVSHDCRVAPYANISPGAILAGGVQVGEGVLIGMGVTVNLNVKVGPGARLGNSSVIKEDVPAGGVVRAGAIWPPEK